MEQLSQFLQLLAVPAAVVIAGALVVVVYNLIVAVGKSIKAKTSPEAFATFQGIVAFAVQAAEQAGLIGLISNIGQEKKRYAIDYIEGQLKAIGLNIDVDVIATAIEGAIANKWHELLMMPDGTINPREGSLNGPAIAKYQKQTLDSLPR